MADMNRRDALRLAFGRGDRIALEREQQSAIDAVRGYATPAPAADAAESDPPADPPHPSRFARLRRLIPFLNRD